MLAVTLAACLVVLGVAPADAIITRHDVDTVADRPSAQRFRAVCKILPDGEGVLIAPRWVLTAAHVATTRRGPVRVLLDGIEYPVDQVFPHPDRDGQRHDLALMRLTRPARGVQPLALHREAVDTDAIVWLAGRGDHGDGLKGILGNDGALRVASNVVSRTDPDRLYVRLDPPGEGATDLEGVSGPGDSGTPALIEVDGRLRVVGVGSMGASPKGKRYGVYGSTDIFVRTSHYLEWIDRTLAGE